jgi:4-hydroxy-tetrahydrodipicolinate synthase
MPSYQGVYVPLLTPMDNDGTVDLAAIGGHVERLLAAGVHGFVALGTTGEFADLTAAERAEVAAATVEVVAGRVPVLVGVGGIGTTEACVHARAAAKAGADGVLALPPLYWKLDDDGLLRHVAAVAEAAGMPVMLYDFPALAGTSLSPAFVARAAAEVPGVVGIKQSGPELGAVHAVLERVKGKRADFAVLPGSTALALPALLAGADGAILALANVAPEPLVAMYAAVRSHDLGEAVRRHRQVVRLHALETLSSPPILALKAGARACGSPLVASVRTPPEDAARIPERATELLARLLADVA